jgi:hypothetical protein
MKVIEAVHVVNRRNQVFSGRPFGIFHTLLSVLLQGPVAQCCHPVAGKVHLQDVSYHFRGA